METYDWKVEAKIALLERCKVAAVGQSLAYSVEEYSKNPPSSSEVRKLFQPYSDAQIHSFTGADPRRIRRWKDGTADADGKPSVLPFSVWKLFLIIDGQVPPI